ncbi:asparagine synthase-related protein [Phosphitispora sp. TUW77]|uniref:asparagine synthase-related protein n=1 Tax=Phosphitispora sp. TUW77 TaxID=3152361 RepID=UPI003AB5FDFB
MAGIVGCIGKKANSERVEQMIQEIKHRGLSNPIIKTLPAASVGFIEVNPCGVGGEAPPFVFIDGSLVCDDNQEGVSDADYLREKYIQHGKDVFSKISGSFACVIMDEEECIIARDHVGARGLIYNKSPESELFFASEAKALKQVTDNVEELLPGHYFSTKEGLRPFDDCSVILPKWDTAKEAISIVRELIFKAVERAVSSGNFKGVALSGGLDSSIILAVAHKFDKNIKAFTATIAETPGEDLEYAKLLADYLGVEHHIYKITQEDIKKIIPKAVWHLESFDEDCIVGFIANYYASLLASKHVNSILVGEGSDELFGGYFREFHDIPEVAEKERISRKLVDISYNTALRRLDRGWMSNSIEYNAPFLDPEVVAISKEIPMDLKVYQGDLPVEKWILREAFRDILPQEIANRPKLRFARGVGVEDQVDKVVPDNIGEEELKQTPKSAGGISLKSPKELYFYKLFQEQFPKGYEGLTARWDPFK